MTRDRELECRSQEPTKWHLRLLQEAAQTANAADSYPGACREILRLLLRHCGWPAGHALLPDRNLDHSHVVLRGSICLAPGVDDPMLPAILRMPLPSDRGPLAELSRSRSSVWIEDLDQDERFRRPALGRHGIEASLLVPVTRNDTLVGALEILTSREDRPGRALLVTLDTVGMQLGHVHARKRLERAVAEASDEAQRVLARELHDSVGQQMTGLSMLALGLARDLEEEGGSRARRAQRLHEGIGEAQQRLRAVSRGLMPVEVDAHGLSHALSDLARSTREMCQVECRLLCDEPIVVESRAVSTNLFRVAQEAVHNAVTHGRPRHIDILLEREDDSLRLVVRDDGSGMPDPSSLRRGLGLESIGYRIGLLEGHLEIRSTPGRGTEICCEIEDGE